MNVEKPRLVAVRLTPKQFRTRSEDERELLIRVSLGDAPLRGPADLGYSAPVSVPVSVNRSL